MNNLVPILSALGVFQAVLLCTYLFSLKDKRSNALLAFMLLGLILTIAKSVVDIYTSLPSWLRIIGISGKLASGPLLWLYGEVLIRRKELFLRHYLHLIPFVVFVLFSWALPNGADFLSYAVAAIIFLHCGSYLVACWVIVARNAGGSRLTPWYRNIVIGVTIQWFLFAAIFIGLIPVYVLGAVFFSFLIYIFSYLLLKRHVFQLEKYGASAVTPEVSRQLLKQVKDLFEKQELYLDSSITLKTVADKLATTPRELSQIINESAQVSFPEFVNQYRIARAQVLLTDPAYGNEKIETIAYDCGFGNVTSFNLAFKAKTGQTPTQYRSQVRLS